MWKMDFFTYTVWAAKGIFKSCLALISCLSASVFSEWRLDTWKRSGYWLKDSFYLREIRPNLAKL